MLTGSDEDPPAREPIAKLLSDIPGLWLVYG